MFLNIVFKLNCDKTKYYRKVYIMKNNQWSSRLGFVLATAGAAIGLGNLWKFPYIMGRNGGFSFLIVYLLFIVILGLPVMMLEMSLGRYSGKNPVESYKKINKKAGIVGFLGVFAAFVILSYYSVIGGWILKYLFSYVTTANAPADFAAFSASNETVFWHFLFMASAVIICLMGVKGIEKASKFMMPALFILMIIIIVRTVTLPNAVEGLKFMFVPSDNSSFTFTSISEALGQVFYSLSLCMGITITYGSYLKKDENIPKSCAQVAVMDTAIAVLAGIAIFPAVFSFGLDVQQGPGLIFGTLPKIFSEIGGGFIFAIAFFILVFFAAVTSAIALLEVPVSYVTQKWKIGRKKAVLGVGFAIFLLGVPSCLATGALSGFTVAGYNFFDLMSVFTDNILLPLSGLLMCWFVGWRWEPKILANEMALGAKKFKLAKVWVFTIKYITPILILVVTISGFVNIYNTVTA